MSTVIRFTGKEEAEKVFDFLLNATENGFDYTVNHPVCIEDLFGTSLYDPFLAYRAAREAFIGAANTMLEDSSILTVAEGRGTPHHPVDGMEDFVSTTAGGYH